MNRRKGECRITNAECRMMKGGYGPSATSRCVCWSWSNHVPSKDLMSVVCTRVSIVLVPGFRVPVEIRRSRGLQSTGWKALRTDSHRYLLRADGQELLFDLADDPGEYDNVAGEARAAAVLADARRELARRLIELERPLPRAWAY